jgi:trk system potassium uptake protein TrkH
LELFKKYLKITYNYLLDLTNKVQRVVNLFLSTILPLLGLTALLLVIYYFGFTTSEAINAKIVSVIKLSSLVFLVGYTLRFLFMFRLNLKLTVKKSEAVTQLFWVLLLFLYYLFFGSNPEHNIIFDFAWVFIIFFLEFSKLINSLTKFINNANGLFLSSFGAIILIGAALLKLPNATYEGISFIDAIFSATSAVCVTGLSVVDFATDFTFLGQVVLLILIQIGGLGLMTFTTLFGFLFTGTSSIKSNTLLKDVFETSKSGAFFKLISKIIIVTLFFEGIGFLLIFNLVVAQNSISDPVFFSIFHSISSFCNAGISTINSGFENSLLKTFSALKLTMACLAILGGLGFPVIFYFYEKLKTFFKSKANKLFKSNFKFNRIRLSMQSRLVLQTTAILLFGSFLAFLVLEWNYSGNEKNIFTKIVDSFFMSAIPRSVGYKNFDFQDLHPISFLLLMLLAWIGCSPTSTGGGIKTSTFALAFINIKSLAQGKTRIEFIGRTIPSETLQRAFAVIFLSFIVMFLSAICLNLVQPEIPIKLSLYEAFGAYTTVGFSLGATEMLNFGGKVIVILTMFLGRVGALTLIIFMIKNIRTEQYTYPKENILIN